MSKSKKLSDIQRRKLREIGIKKTGYLTLRVHCKKILEALEKEGPLIRKQIMRFTKIPNGTIDRALNVLCDLGRIERVHRRYMLHSDIYIYMNMIDRDRALDHSKKIASGLLSIIQMPRYHVGGELTPSIEYEEDALKHLRTAPEYCKTYNAFKESKKAEREAHEEEKRIVRGLKERTLSKRLKFKDKSKSGKIIAKEVYKDIMETLKGNEPPFLTNLTIGDGQVKSGSYALAPEKEFDKLRKLVLKEEKSVKNVNDCKKILELDNSHYETWKEFKKAVKLLIKQVENGTPLKGRCNQCPNVITLPEKALNLYIQLIKEKKAIL